ncbi:MAG: VWA domain-containing protein [Oligoflexia bacterium]|nr:VWA domain-containing protein [Oligoflexia bacterium]
MKMRNHRILMLSLAATWLMQLLAWNSQAVAHQGCGLAADADIVIMLDKTGSINYTELARERAAAKALLGFFGTAAVKPRVAVGSFNVVNGPDARIEIGGALTSNYGADGNPGSGLYAAINSIGFSTGHTNLADAIVTAQGEIAAHAKGSKHYIILISDGIANEPSGLNPSFCSGGNPGAAAISAAEAAKSAGTKIFTVNYPDDGLCPANTGAVFLRTRIASSTEYYYAVSADLSNLSGILLQIGESIGCNDNDPCTQDFCSDSTHSCSHVNTCIPTPTPVPGCEGLTGTALQNCLGCTDVDVKPIQLQMDSGALELKNTAIRTANIILQHATSRRQLRFARSIKQQADSLYRSAWGITWSMPQISSSCPGITCVQISNTVSIQSFVNNSDALRRLVLLTANKAARIVPAKAARAGKLAAIAEKIHAINTANAELVPSVAGDCTTALGG